MESIVEYYLSNTNLNEVPFDKYEPDFTFIVNGKPYPTHRIVADILSPIIRQLHFSDETIDQYTINTDDNSESEDYFSDFLNLPNLRTVQIDSNRQKMYSKYFYILGNTDECFRVQPELLENLTPSNVVSVLKKFVKIDTKKSSRINEAVKFASAHFEELNKDEVASLDAGIIEKIVSNEDLKIDDEDSLLQFAMKMYESDRSFSFLFEHVLFTNVSEKCLESFIALFDIDDLTSDIWRQICDRLFESKCDSKSDSQRYNKHEIVKEFNNSQGKEFQGIMRHLTDETGGNIHDNGTIEITSNPVYSSSFAPRNCVDYEKTNYYMTKEEGNDAFICFDFKEKSVQLTDYSIKTCDNEPGTYHLKNWVIEVSDDGIKWDEVDNHKNDSTMNKRYITCTFNIQTKTGFHRFVRLRQTGESWYNSGNHTCFLFHQIEFYGKIKIPTK